MNANLVFSPNAQICQFPSAFDSFTTKPNESSPDSERLIKLNGQKVMLFLTLVDDLITDGGTGGSDFEGIRHDGPQKVVDAMDAILNQITHESFGDICNGGTERGRKQAVDGWAMYLYYWKKSEVAPVRVKGDRPK